MSVATASPLPKIEAQVVESATVACDGGNGPAGHPRVYLSFGDGREVTCPYCSRLYRLADGVSAHGH